MRISTRRLLLLLALIAIAAAVHLSGLSGYVTFASLTEHRSLLEQTVARHYLLSVLLYILLYILTALAFPGALILTVAGGVLFHTLPGAIYAGIGAVTGGVLAFVLSRYLLGDWLQTRYEEQFRRFNRELRTVRPPLPDDGATYPRLSFLSGELFMRSHKAAPLDLHLGHGCGHLPPMSCLYLYGKPDGQHYIAERFALAATPLLLAAPCLIGFASDAMEKAQGPEASLPR